HCLIQARIQYDNSNYEEAVKWWEKALTLDAHNKEALKYLKRTQRKMGIIESEEGPATRTYKQELIHCLAQARIQYDNSRYEESVKWWERVLILDPHNKEALDYVERLQYKISPIKKKYAPQTREEALDKIPAKVSKLKRRADKYIQQGKKYYNRHRYQWAISEWKKALLIDPSDTNVAVYIERAEARVTQKPNERKPIEFDMLLKPPPPKIPKPIFEKPKKDILLFEDALNVGVKNHLPMRIAREQIELSQFKEKEAFRELFPQASVQWDETAGIVSLKDFTGRKYNLKVKHPLYSGGELHHTWEQAKVNLEISKDNYKKTEEDYSIELFKAYYELAKTTNNLEVQENLLKDLGQDISMVKKEYEVGVATLVEFLNVQSQYNQAYYSHLSAENNLKLAKSNFLQLLNLDQDPTVNVKIDTKLVFEEHDVDLEECISLAYKNRIDLKMNELRLESAQLGARVAKSQHLPKVDLTGTLGRSAESFDPAKLQMSDSWSVGAKVSVPWGPNTMNYSYRNERISPSLTVFTPTVNEINSVKFGILDNLGRYTEAKRGEITKEEAYSDLIKGKQKAASEVREAYFSYQESSLKVKNALANKELYQKEIVIVKQKRLIGEAQTQDVTSAKVKIATEEVNYNSTVVDNIVAAANLSKAIGIKDYLKYRGKDESKS
ncbi:MAG: TolC family protein, partial [Candidatus Omnitrophica bacterium]|nr:TolC family protein [Candidatus Omnitrophota bacterium]